MARKKLTREDKLTVIRQYSSYYQGENKVNLDFIENLTDDQINRQYLRVTGSVRRRAKNINYLGGERIVLNQLSDAYKVLSTITVDHIGDISIDGMIAIQGQFNCLVDKVDELRRMLEEQKRIVLESSDMAAPAKIGAAKPIVAE